MRLLSFFLVFALLLGIQVPHVSTNMQSVDFQLFSTAFAGSAGGQNTFTSPAPSPKHKAMPSYGKIWKEKFKAMTKPFHKNSDEDLIAALLAFFLGQWGVHKFYQGNTAGGFVMLGITLVGIGLYIGGYLLGIAAIASGSSTFPAGAAILFAIGIIALLVTSIWAFVDFIRILVNM